MSELPKKANASVRIRASSRRSTSDAGTSHEVTAADANPERRGLVSLKLMRFRAVQEYTGLSRSTIWRLERRGDFPKHHRIAPNVVAWVEADITGWIEQRTAVRDGKTKQYQVVMVVPSLPKLRHALSGPISTAPLDEA